MGVEIYQTIGQNLGRRGAIHSVGQEGGYAPNLFTNADAFEVFIESIKQTNYALGAMFSWVLMLPQIPFTEMVNM